MDNGHSEAVQPTVTTKEIPRYAHFPSEVNGTTELNVECLDRDDMLKRVEPSGQAAKCPPWPCFDINAQRVGPFSIEQAIIGAGIHFGG
jgi:hypothetical protein